MAKAKDRISAHSIVCVPGQTEADLLRPLWLIGMQCGGKHSHGKFMRIVTVDRRFHFDASELRNGFIMHIVAPQVRGMKIRGGASAGQSKCRRLLSCCVASPGLGSAAALPQRLRARLTRAAPPVLRLRRVQFTELLGRR